MGGMMTKRRRAKNAEYYQATRDANLRRQRAWYLANREAYLLAQKLTRNGVFCPLAKAKQMLGEQQ